MGRSTPKAFLVSLSSIDVDDQALRYDPEDDSIIELANDIAQKGLLQPIGVSDKSDGRYQLRWGGRRLAAHKRLNHHQIWARLWEGTDISVKALALVENLQRRQLTLQEEVDAVSYLANTEKQSIDQISAALSKSRTWVLNRLMIPNLPHYLKEPLIAGDLPLGHVEEIAKVEDEGAQRYLLAQSLQNRWNRSQIRQVAEVYLNSPSIAQINEIPNTPGIPPINYHAPVYQCQICGTEGPIDKYTLVRVCKDGCRPEPAGNRSTDPSNPSDGLASDPGSNRS